MQLLPSWPCSQLPHAPLEDTRPTHSTTQAASLQLEGFKLQTSRKWISEQGLFFFFLFWREAEKAAPLGSCCPRLLKTLGGLRTTQEASGCWLRPEPLVWVPPPTWGLPNSPLRSMLPFLTHLTGSLAQMPAQPQGLHRTMRPHLQGMSVNPGALHRAADRGERQQIPG